ncbi:hypothetical protein [Chitiniphilus shinanonensis]|uniref:hypothetical protein n=1 Tax=Chitiniphilus shinanonensis TaxID=553088 RepID=UPI0030567A8F
MESKKINKPPVVIVTTVVLGVLSFLSYLLGGYPLDLTGMLSLVQKVIFTLGFIGALSGTIVGRRIVIAVLAFLLLGSCAGFLAAFGMFVQAPGTALFVFVLSVLPVVWFYRYTFGLASKRYFQEVAARQGAQQEIPGSGR